MKNEIVGWNGKRERKERFDGEECKFYKNISRNTVFTRIFECFCHSSRKQHFERGTNILLSIVKGSIFGHKCFRGDKMTLYQLHFCSCKLSLPFSEPRVSSRWLKLRGKQLKRLAIVH